MAVYDDDAPGAGADDDDGDAAGFGSEAGPAIRRREFSPKTRELFKRASAAVKAEVAAHGGVDDLVPAIAGEDDDEDVPAIAAPAAAQAAVAPATVPAPAPSLDPRNVAEWEKLNRERATFAEERKRWDAERATVAAELGAGEEYLEHPAKVISALVKKWTGITDDAELKDEVADLITSLSAEALGLPLSADVRSRIEARQARKIVKAHTAKLTRKEQAIARREEQAQQQQERVSAERMLAEGVTQQSAAFPYLASEDSPGEIVYDVIKTHHDKSGEVLDWKVAAQRANDYLKEKADAYYARRRHLFSEAPAPQGTPTPPTSAPQGDPSGIRRSRTLRNGPSSAPSGQSPVDASGRFDNEAHRKQSLGRLRERIKQPEE